MIHSIRRWVALKREVWHWAVLVLCGFNQAYRGKNLKIQNGWFEGNLYHHPSVFYPNWPDKSRKKWEAKSQLFAHNLCHIRHLMSHPYAFQARRTMGPGDFALGGLHPDSWLRVQDLGAIGSAQIEGTCDTGGGKCLGWRCWERCRCFAGWMWFFLSLTSPCCSGRD